MIFYNYKKKHNVYNLLETVLADSNLASKYVEMNTLDNNIAFGFSVDLTQAEVTALDGYVANHVVNTSPIKIVNLARRETATLDFKDINYKVQLKTNLFPKRTIVQGEVTNVKWYANQGLTNLVLNVDVEYTRDPMGFAIRRKVTRTWYRADETAVEEKKITEKLYTINPSDQIKEGVRRRQNIVDYVQLPTMGFMVETLHPMPVPQVLLLGRDFMDRMEPESNNFVKSSSSVTDTQSPDFGKKKVVVWLETQTDSWLDNLPAALAGVTIRQWLIGEFTI